MGASACGGNRRGAFRCLVLAVGLLASRAAPAHDFWIEPERFRLEAPGPVAVTLRVGERFKGESVPYIDAWIERFESHDGAGVRAVAGQVGDDPAGHVTPRTPGSSWIAYQSRDDFVELPPEKFRAYLEMEGMEYVLPLRAARGQEDAPAREYYARCAKALLHAPGAGGVEVEEPLGLTLEIVPERDPYGLEVGASFGVRLLYLGRPVPGLLVKAFTREAPEREEHQRTDADGRARVTLDRAGTWIVKTVHMVALDGDTYGDWRSYWASLTFALPERVSVQPRGVPSPRVSARRSPSLTMRGHDSLPISAVANRMQKR